MSAKHRCDDRIRLATARAKAQDQFFACVPQRDNMHLSVNAERRLTMADQRRRRPASVADDPIRLMNPPPEEAQVPEDAIRNRAHEIYERRGGEEGRDWDDWLEAERELRREQDE
jgi:DUF2934 family protein